MIFWRISQSRIQRKTRSKTTTMFGWRKDARGKRKIKNRDEGGAGPREEKKKRKKRGKETPFYNVDQGEPDRAKLNRTGPIQISSKETELSVETTSNQLRVPSLVYSCLSHTFGRNGRNFLSQITAFFGSFSSRFSLFWARKYSNKVYEYKLFPIVVEKFLENIFF